MESALKQFISESIPHDYLLALRHNVTKKLTGNIPAIMRSLFTTYGKITAQSLVEKQNILINHTYDTGKPIDTVFNLAKDFTDYSTAFGTPQPPETIITYCYNILRKTGRFNNALQKWNEKLDADKTWENFKTHFCQAHQHLREFAPSTVTDAGYTREMANAIAEGVANIINEPTENTQETEAFIKNLSQAVEHNQQMLPQLFQSLHLMSENINSLQNDIHSLNATTQQRRPAQQQQNPPPPQPGTQFQAPPPPQQFHPHINAPPGFNGFIPPPMNQQQFYPPPARPFQYSQRGVTSGRGGRGRYQGYGGRGGQGGGSGRGYQQQQRQQQQNHFCWSHGFGNHPSGQCRNPAYGHQWSATARDPMGSPNAVMQFNYN